MGKEYKQVVEGEKPVAIDMGDAMGITLKKVKLVSKGDKEVTITVSFVPLADGEIDEDQDAKKPEAPKRKEDVIATFKDGQTELDIDYKLIDEMEPSIFTSPDAKVEIIGEYDEELIDDDDEEEDEEGEEQAEDDDEDE